MLNFHCIPEHYPKFYYYKQRVSDRDWIIQRIWVIKEEDRQAVSDEYEKLFLTQGRRAANEYLHSEARKSRESIK